jgi:hypothetical protein
MRTNTTVRFDDEELRLLKEVSAARSEDVSTFIRRSVRKELVGLGYFSPEEAKALGVAIATN